MSQLELLKCFFKNETQHSGQVLFDKGSVFLSQTSDTYTQGNIKSTSTLKVSLSATSMDSPDIVSTCSCSSKSLCKHIWALLISTNKSYPDFLINKNFIKRDQNPISQERVNLLAKQKERQSDYRKLQYQKQKLRAAKIKKSHTEVKHPSTVALSLKYFEENGFTFDDAPTTQEIANIRKKLARVFHPDVGGSHQETIELNQHCEVLIRYFHP